MQLEVPYHSSDEEQDVQIELMFYNLRALEYNQIEAALTPRWYSLTESSLGTLPQEEILPEFPQEFKSPPACWGEELSEVEELSIIAEFANSNRNFNSYN